MRTLDERTQRIWMDRGYRRCAAQQEHGREATMTFHRTQVLGNLGDDPDVKIGPTGTTRTIFRVAVLYLRVTLPRLMQGEWPSRRVT